MTYDLQESSRYSGAPYELYLFTLGTSKWRLTSSDVGQSYLGKDYAPETIAASEISQNQELRSGSIKVMLPRAHQISNLFAAYIPPTPMTLTIYRGHTGDPETITYFVGTVATATFREHCELLCVPDQEALKRRIPIQKYQAQCNWALFSPGCGIASTAFSVNGTIASVSGVNLVVTGFDAKPNGYFAAGWLQKGDYRRMIMTHAGTLITLINPIIGLNVGDAVVGFPGCMGDMGTCKNKFNNLSNFWGFPRIPTRSPFDGVE